MKIQRLAIVFTVTFAATLAVVVAQRLSTEMTAVIVGVVAGVVASIPTSLIVVWVARNALAAPVRSDPASERAARERSVEPVDRETKIIVVPAPTASYPAGNSWLPYNPPISPYAASSPPRPFTIIGGEATSDETPLSWR